MTMPSATETTAVCPVCQGSRTAAKCRRCTGTRHRQLGISVGSIQTTLDLAEPCPECQSGAALCYACGGTGRLVPVAHHGSYGVIVRPNRQQSGPTFDSLREARETDGHVSRMEPWQRALCQAAFANPDVNLTLEDWAFGRVGEYSCHVLYTFRRPGPDSDCVLVSLSRGGEDWEWFARAPYTTRVLYQRD
jgi:hypothetical protein